MFDQGIMVLKAEGTWQGTALALDEICAQHYNRGMVRAMTGNGKAEAEVMVQSDDVDREAGRDG